MISVWVLSLWVACIAHKTSHTTVAESRCRIEMDIQGMT